jgi:hypothetical protein
MRRNSCAHVGDRSGAVRDRCGVFYSLSDRVFIALCEGGGFPENVEKPCDAQENDALEDRGSDTADNSGDNELSDGEEEPNNVEPESSSELFREG